MIKLGWITTPTETQLSKEKRIVGNFNSVEQFGALLNNLREPNVYKLISIQEIY